MKNIKLKIAYDGTNYKGWQIQENANTIQGEITRALEKICRHKVILHAAGRTDAGVHAKEQVANFLTESSIPTPRYPTALKSLLPHDIVVYEAEEEMADFHARFSAISKTYSYQIDNGKYPEIFNLRFSHHEPRKLRTDLMEHASKYLLGKHNFLSFCASGGSSKTFERTITSHEIAEKNQFILIRFTADGFLYHMVRNLVGMLIEVGLGKIDPEYTKTLLEARDRRLAPATAPAKGLCLEKVIY